MIRLFPVLFAGAFSISYGLASSMFATMSLTGQIKAWPHFSAALLLSAADIVIGLTAAVAGFSILLKHEWARRLLRDGAPAVALYELGRRLGAATASSNDWKAEQLAYYALMIFAIVLVRYMAESKAARSYIADTSQ